MSDKYLENQIQRIYERMKHGRVKGYLLCMLIYIFMGGIVSLFLGNPFPHREGILFVNDTETA